MKAIETIYNGYRFRSRLEARWAVFFDVLGIRYRYELEGIDTQAGKYLPDFWLPHSVNGLAEIGWGFLAEIKPEAPSHREQFNLWIAAAVETKANFLLFAGDPWPDEYEVFKICVTHRDTPDIIGGLQFKQDDGVVHLLSQDGAFGSFPSVYNGNLSAAYKAARQARFEHGENGRLASY